MNKSISVTIGIPAYNEEANIAKLLMALLAESRDNWKLDKIMVYSDGSTDRTNDLVYGFREQGVALYKSRSRRGVATGLNELIRRATSDVLILLNADITPVGRHFISSFLKPFRSDTPPGLVACRVTALPGNNFLERVLVWSHHTKQELYEKTNQEILLTHGRGRALSRALYQELHFPGIIAEDSYSYLRCRELRHDFVYLTSTSLTFRSPATLSDHLLQSRRFFRGIQELASLYPSGVLRLAYKLPLIPTLFAWGNASWDRPLYALSYFFILVFAFISRNYQAIRTGAAWDPSTTSKKI